VGEGGSLRVKASRKHVGKIDHCLVTDFEYTYFSKQSNKAFIQLHKKLKTPKLFLN